MKTTNGGIEMQMFAKVLSVVIFVAYGAINLMVFAVNAQQPAVTIDYVSVVIGLASVIGVPYFGRIMSFFIAAVGGAGVGFAIYQNAWLCTSEPSLCGSGKSALAYLLIAAKYGSLSVIVFVICVALFSWRGSTKDA